MIDCRTDYPGLRTAAAEMYVESFLRKDLDELLEGSTREGAVEALGKVLPARSVAHGYYQWVAYLMWLRSVTALPGAQIELMADEAEGLLVLADAEREFRNCHPSCFKCGALNEEAAWSCRKCQAEFKR
jgi:ribosomal protein L40E